MALLDQALVALGNLLNFARGLMFPKHDKGGHIQKGLSSSQKGPLLAQGARRL